MPIYGKLGDLRGRRQPFLVAITVFVIGSTGSALSGTFVELVAWRSVQGLGAGGLVILSQAIIADIVSARDRGRFMGPMGAVFGVATVAGPLLGGWFTDGPGWRWCFWLNVPVGLVALAIAYTKLRLPSRRSTSRFDIGGAVLLTLATSGIVLLTSWRSITDARRYDWSNPALMALARRHRRRAGAVPRRGDPGGRPAHPAAPVPEPDVLGLGVDRPDPRHDDVRGPVVPADVPADGQGLRRHRGRAPDAAR